LEDAEPERFEEERPTRLGVQLARLPRRNKRGGQETTKSVRLGPFFFDCYNSNPGRKVTTRRSQSCHSQSPRAVPRLDRRQQISHLSDWAAGIRCAECKHEREEWVGIRSCHAGPNLLRCSPKSRAIPMAIAYAQELSSARGNRGECGSPGRPSKPTWDHGELGHSPPGTLVSRTAGRLRCRWDEEQVRILMWPCQSSEGWSRSSAS
jgi:hypothetical protein